MKPIKILSYAQVNGINGCSNEYAKYVNERIGEYISEYKSECSNTEIDLIPTNLFKRSYFYFPLVY